VFSYCGWVMVSLTSCREMMPDPGFFGECLDQSFEALREATGVAAPQAASTA